MQLSPEKSNPCIAVCKLLQKKFYTVKCTPHSDIGTKVQPRKNKIFQNDKSTTLQAYKNKYIAQLIIAQLQH